MFFGFRRLLLAASALLPLVALGQNVAPEITAPINNASLFVAGPAEVVPLADHFDDPDTSGVRLTTVLGNVDLALYDQRTPITVANFKNYIDSGRYLITDPTTGDIAPLFVHRSVAGFVIQSGGWLGTVNPADPVHVQVTPVQHFAAIMNEPGISNTRGTIAMAKLPTDPDSATSEWYINLADNLSLDTDNGGFTVFGRVIGDGMTVVDAIAAVPIFNFGSPFDTLPLRNFTAPGLPTPDNLISIPAISYTSPLVFSASSNHPSIASVVVSGSNLLVSGKALGTATITATATDSDGAQISQMFDVNVIANPMHLANLSTRAFVGTNDDVMIGGFIVQGDAPKRLAVRALGPSLAVAGITNFLPDPIVEIHDSSGATIASNDNWQEASNSQDVIDAKLAPADPNESVVLLSLPASNDGTGYTAVVHGANNGTGIGLVEVYDLDSGPGASVLNISTRSNVKTDDEVMIGGFIVGGTGSQSVLVRAIGPSLAQFLSNPLGDPTLTLYDGNGTQLDFNDNWQESPDADAIAATNIPPNDPKEAAILATLAPGGYTAIVRGAGSAPTGTGLVEVYAITL